MNPAVTTAEDDQAFAVDDGDDRSVLRGIGGDAAGGGAPVQFTRGFVECEDPVLAAGILTPTEANPGDDDLIFINRR